jgi:hypothetical protein
MIDKMNPSSDLIDAWKKPLGMHGNNIGSS